jgi:Immunity protein 8
MRVDSVPFSVDFDESQINPTYFGLHVALFIGLDNEPGVDLFDCFVYSPNWLADHFGAVNPENGAPVVGWGGWQPDTGAVLTPGLILMPVWSREALELTIDWYCQECAAPDFATSASRLTRCLPWEYEYKFDEYVDYHPDQFRLPPGWASRGYRPVDPPP